MVCPSVYVNRKTFLTRQAHWWIILILWKRCLFEQKSIYIFYCIPRERFCRIWLKDISCINKECCFTESHWSSILAIDTETTLVYALSLHIINCIYLELSQISHLRPCVVDDIMLPAIVCLLSWDIEYDTAVDWVVYIDKGLYYKFKFRIVWRSKSHTQICISNSTPSNLGDKKTLPNPSLLLDTYFSVYTYRYYCIKNIILYLAIFNADLQIWNIIQPNFFQILPLSNRVIYSSINLSDVSKNQETVVIRALLTHQR